MCYWKIMKMTLSFKKNISNFLLWIKLAGFRETFIQIYKYVTNYRLRRKLYSLSDAEERFTYIYNTNFWRDKESVSGEGSTLKFTESIRRELPYIFDKLNIQSIFDAPCGDFNWMKEVICECDVLYTGGDIVRPLIERNLINYSNDDIKFIHLDLTRDRFPYADMMFCRDCLFHLSFADTKKLLSNFIISGSLYLMTTTHKNHKYFTNIDIANGQFRLIDLFSPPYNFPITPVLRVDDFVAPYPPREMCVWRRDQIMQALAEWK